MDDSRFEEDGEWSPQWVLVRGDDLTPLPVPQSYSPQLSADGRVAFWEDLPRAETTRFVTWDTETNSPLASRTVPGNMRLQGSLCRIDLLGIDAAGIGHVLDQASKAPVTRWDVRADTVAPTDLTYDPAKTLNQFDASQGLDDAYVSPDGTREVFTGPAPGDSPAGCCATQFRVRPVAQPGPARRHHHPAVTPGDPVDATVGRLDGPRHLDGVVGDEPDRSRGHLRRRPQLPRALLDPRRSLPAGPRPRPQQQRRSLSTPPTGKRTGLARASVPQ